MKIPLTHIQRAVFDRIVELTEHGKKTHTGPVRVASICGSTSRNAVTQCALLGLIKVEVLGRDLRLTLLMGPESVETTSAKEIMAHRMTGRSLREDKNPADTGLFSEAFEAAFGKQGYPSLKMKRDLPFKGTFKPDARAL